MSEAPTPQSAPEPVEPPASREETLRNLALLAILAVAAFVWWDVFRRPVMFVLTLSILVAVHEWGHFIAAKAVGVRVYEFAIGFGPRLVTYMRRGGTDYTIRALPLGGFVNPKGMQPDDPITSDGLNGRRPAERALVYLAGPLMNVILATLILTTSGWLFGGADRSKALVLQVTKGREAARMEVASVNGAPASGVKPGLRVGDHVLAVNGQPVTYDNVTRQIHPNAAKPIVMTVRRGKDTLELRGTPREAESARSSFLFVASAPEGSPLDVRQGDQLWFVDDLDAFDEGEMPAKIEAYLREKRGQPVTLGIWRGEKEPIVLRGPAPTLTLAVRSGRRFEGQLGFMPTPGQGPRISFGESVQNGLGGLQGFGMAMARIFSSTRELKRNVGGPIAIFDQMGAMDRLPLMYFLGALASLSLSLAFFNLLPVPVLDGGHMLMLTVEVVRRRRLEPDTQRAVALVGLALIGVLFVYITYKDIVERIL
jgi:regulator of sigma E protease